ncbi:phosphoinositide phosphatase SAC2-like isoform X2 [Cicer arietinum]|uniref:Phosphoinositide phosphatase SAC2-like isoform X2 n=1 Tax=Cicer arietinum TaxID=3827 RepID=A0A1S3EE51_CICAR|nr:phosphoinositide phosphatase SAC2-like isoform X2 [Cicer arietinum]
MEISKEKLQRSVVVDDGVDFKSCYMQKFRLYESRSRFYMIGRDKNRTFWRVLKIDRSEPSELNIIEDSTVYSEVECCDLLRRLHEGNKSTGGLKFVTTCYGIIGFIKFLEPYYMLLITKRRKIGTICGHTVYAITKSEMIPIPHASVRSKMAYSKDENRYKKLLCSMDLTKDFFYSYSYNIMLSLQKNVSSHNFMGQSLYETLFVWNEFLTRGIRNNLQNTSWTVALVYGFFKQVKLSISGSEFNLIIIARRSRHYAGTRYLKRGVNEKGRVANDVETEQIVFADASDGSPMQISSVVQIRGSIPLFWTQEASPLNIKPDIILSPKDSTFEATRLHFENLTKRYGNPIIILNLIKTREKKPRETILRKGFSVAVRSINQNLRGENRLRFLHWDLNKHSKCKATNVLAQLGKVAAYALKLTGIFYCPLTPDMRLFQHSYSENNDVIDQSVVEQASINKYNDDKEKEVGNGYCSDNENKDYCVKPKMYQAGVLRTNCIDCLDRTNVAQYAYGLIALGRQLQVLGFTETPYLDLDNPLAKELMTAYESMGDTLAFQYGGSAAHNKIFSERRGQWKAAAQSQELIRTLQRYYNNTYLDVYKQKTINIFLGHFQPQQGKPALWELDSDQYYTVGKHGPDLADGSVRSSIKRSLSDGNILGETDTTIRNLHAPDCQHSSEKPDKQSLLESTSDIFTCGSSICHCRKIYGGMDKDQYCDNDHICYDEHGDAGDCSNFLDVDWLSSSGNSCEEELLERSTSISSDNIVNELVTETSANESGPFLKERQSEEELNKVGKYTNSFEHWVTHGEMLYV